MLDAQMKQIIELYESLDLPSLDEDTSVEELRAMMTQYSNNPLKKLQHIGEKIQDFKAPTLAGEVRIRGYYPERKVDSAPILFFRGSGFVVQNFEDSDDFCIRLAKETQKVILSVDYPLAPENPFPKSLEACLEVYQWAREHAEFANLDPKEMILIGESSGGCLVALLSALIRDRGLPSFKMQVLLYPILDHTFLAPSYEKYATGYIMTTAKLKWYLAHYQKGLSDDQKPFAFPLQHTQFKNLPPTLIYNAEYDPLCDDGKIYGEKLIEAGAPCKIETHKGMIHGFIKFKGLKAPDEIFKKLCQFLSSQTNLGSSKAVSPF